MIINISHLLKGNIDKIDIKTQLYHLFHELKDDSIEVEGILYVEDNALKVDFQVKMQVHLVCSRCIEEFNSPLNLRIQESYDLVEDQGILQNATIDLTELLRENILLNLPIKPLCEEHCKGLCAECGTNLNVHSCKCNNEPVDPRLSVLKNLLNGDE